MNVLKYIIKAGKFLLEMIIFIPKFFILMIKKVSFLPCPLYYPQI